MSSELEIYPRSSFKKTLKNGAPTSTWMVVMEPSRHSEYWKYKVDKQSYEPHSSRLSPSEDMRSRHEAAVTSFCRKLTKARLSTWMTGGELDIEHSIRARDFSCRTGDDPFPPKSYLWPDITRHRFAEREPYVDVTVGDVSRLGALMAYLPLPSSNRTPFWRRDTS